MVLVALVALLVLVALATWVYSMTPMDSMVLVALLIPMDMATLATPMALVDFGGSQFSVAFVGL